VSCQEASNLNNIALIERPERIPAEHPAYDADFRVIEPERSFASELPRYWKIVSKHLGFVLAVPVTFAALMLIHDLLATPIYTATATLLIKGATPKLFGRDENDAPGQPDDQTPVDPTSQMTEYELLKSQSLAERALMVQGRLPPGTKELALTGAVDAYLGSMKVKPVEGTELVKISFANTDPKVAAQMANSHAREFIRWGIELNSQSSDEAESFLQSKLTELKTQLQASEAAVNDYRRDKGIIPGLISMDGKSDVVLERLDKLDGEAQEAHLRTIGLDTELSMANSGKPYAIPWVATSHLIQGLQAKRDALKTEYETLSEKFTKNYPRMVQLRAEMAATQRELNQEIAAAVARVGAEREAAWKRETAVDAELNKQKAFALGLNNAAVRYGMLEREADTNRELYNAVLKRMKDLTLISDLHASNVSVVDQAQVPLGPSSPHTVLDVMVAALAGLVGGLAITFLLEHLDNTVRDADEAQKLFARPVLAIIPEESTAHNVTYGNGRVARLKYLSRPKQSNLVDSSNGNEMIARYNSGSVLGEAYRHLRTSLQLSRAGSHPRSTLITSALPEEGKTTIAINTAMVLAHTGVSVLLIDADLRKPRCHEVLKLKNGSGLTELLTGVGEFSPIGTEIENLYLLSAGQCPPNPSELLGSDKMKEILQAATEEYDYVIVDSPPAAVVSDAILLSTLVDGVVMVVGSGRTPTPVVNNALSKLGFAKAIIFGIVLNRVTMSTADPWLFGTYHYGAYYVRDPGKSSAGDSA